MNNPEIEAALQRHLEATAYALTNVRDENGSCLLRRTMRGEPYLKTCALRPLIDSRIQFRVDQEAPPPAVEVLHTDTTHVCRRRA